MSLLRKFNLFGSNPSKIAVVDEANTARTTSTNTLVVQNIDSSGNVAPAGQTLVNAPYSKDTIYNSSGTEIFTNTNPGAISDGGDSITVDGSVTVTQNTGSNLHTVLDSGTLSTITNVVHVDDNSSTLSIDDGGSSITVDGSVSVTLPMDAANTVRTIGTLVLPVQNVDASGKVAPAGETLANAPYSKSTIYNSSGTEIFTNSNPAVISDGGSSITVDGTLSVNVLPTDAANTARTTGTLVLPVQNIDASGKVSPAGDSESNAPFSKITDGSNILTLDNANTARTTGTKVLPIQNIDASGKVAPAGETLANAPYCKATIYSSSGTELFTDSSQSNVTIKDEYGFGAECTPSDELRTITPTRLVGTVFSGTKDTNFWTETIANNGTITISNNEVTASTKTTSANGSAVYQTVRKARFLAGSSQKFRCIIKVSDTGTTDNSRKWGAFDGTDGAYFELDGTNVYVVTLKGGSPTRVLNSSWNASTTLPTLTNYNAYEIYYVNRNVYFVINGILKHTITITDTPWSNTLILPARFSTTNINSLQTDHTITVLAMSIYRLGQLSTTTQYKYISTGTTTVCKYSAGVLQSIVVNNPSNNAITIYDATSAVGGTEIGIINPGSAATPFVLQYGKDGIPFSTGLTIVTGGTINITVIYE